MESVIAPRAGHELRYKRPTSVPQRISDWEQWKADLVARDEAVLESLGRGKNCPVSVDLMNLKYNPLPSQAKFHSCNTKYKGYSGPIGCVAGETKLDGSHHDATIEELCRNQIAPVVETLLGPVQAEIPYLKGRADLYAIRLTTGETIQSTLDHLLFARRTQSWQPVRSLSAGDYILQAVPVLPLKSRDRSSKMSVGASPCRHRTGSKAYPFVSQINERRCWRTDKDWTDHYSVLPTDPLVCDERPHWVVDSALALLPLPAGAHERSRWHYSADGQASEGRRSHFSSCGLPSSGSCSGRAAHSYAESDWQLCNLSEPWLIQPSPSDGIFGSTIDSLRTYLLSSRYSNNRPFHLVDPFCKYTSQWGLVESIRLVGIADFYDIGVPIAEHYLSNGLWHHNSGKSRALAYEALFNSAINPNCAGYVTAPTHTMLRDAAQTAIVEMLQEEGIAYDYKGGEFNVITFKAGDPNFDATQGRMTPSQIYFRTASNPDRLRGPNIAWFGMDEMTYSDEEAWKVLVGRIRHPYANQHNGFGCWTPKGFDWVYNLFINEETRNPVAETIFSTPGENIHLPEDFYSSIRAQYDPAWAKQELEGQYLSVFQGQVYHAYNHRENVQPVDYVPGVALNWTLDFNVKPFCSVLLQLIDGPHQKSAGRSVIKPWSEIWAIGEIVLQDGNTYQMCEEFRRRTEKWVDQTKNRIEINLYGDATGARKQTSAFASDWEIIRSWFVEHAHSYRVNWRVNVEGQRQNPPIRARVNAVNAALCDSNGIHRLRINPSCRTLLNDLQSVSWRKGDEGLNMDEGKKRELTHASDALGYYIVQNSGYAEAMDYMRQRLEGF